MTPIEDEDFVNRKEEEGRPKTQEQGVVGGSVHYNRVPSRRVYDHVLSFYRLLQYVNKQTKYRGSYKRYTHPRHRLNES